MARKKRSQTHDCGGGQRVTTVRRSGGGPRVRVGYPPDSVLVHAAAAADRRYIRKLFRRAILRLADIIEDDRIIAEGPHATRVATTLAHVAPDGTIITAHNGTAQITIFIRDAATGQFRALPLLRPYDGETPRIRRHNLHAAAWGIKPVDDIFICLENEAAHHALPAAARCRALTRFFNRPQGTPEKAAEYLTSLAARAGAPGHITITFAQLLPIRRDYLLLALFEGQGAEGHRLAAGLVPVISGILEFDRLMERRAAARRGSAAPSP